MRFPPKGVATHRLKTATPVCICVICLFCLFVKTQMYVRTYPNIRVLTITPLVNVSVLMILT